MQGNSILSAPYGDDLWGPLASTGGVLVTVEKIVPTELIRRYSALVKIPGSSVNSVSLAPMGVHPFSFTNPGIDEFEPYEMDTEFLNDLHRASMNNDTLNSWIKEWVVDCIDHDHYLKKLGDQRISKLKETGNIAVSQEVTPSMPESPLSKEGVSPKEMMLIVVAREVIKSVKKSKHKMILVGAGSRAIAALLAFYSLKAENYEVELITGNGQIGYTPQQGGSILPSENSVRSSKMLSDTITTHGVFVGGKNNKCLSVLGAGQIDKYGNINSTTTSQGQFLVGSGGANDSVNSREVIITLNQSGDRFLNMLPYITSRGDNVTTVVSTMGIYRKSNQDGEFYLTECFPTIEITNLAQMVKRIEDNCGWPLKLAPEVLETSGPTEDEVQLLRSLVSSFSGNED
ncbi:hypothetical protein ACFLZG_03680 [Thermodesulfobacteriota bacterium]